MKSFLTISLVAFGLMSQAQIQLPSLSPEGKIIQTIGYTHFTLRYERPAARGRKIIGNLVPFNKLWRTGAGKCTTIKFDQPSKINNQTVAPGIYALLTIPSASEWTIMLNSDTSKIYGDPSEYDLKKEVVRFSAKSHHSDRFYESLSLELDVTNNDAMLFLSWENTQVSFLLATNTYEIAEEKIQTALMKNPTDVQMLSSTAYYYEMNNRDLSKALEYIKRAMTQQDDWWYYRIAVDITVKLKDYPAASDLARKAVQFLQRTKPSEWQKIEETFQDDIKKYSTK